MKDYCIENDFAAQKEYAEKEASRELRLLEELLEFRKAMESYMGKSRCFEALEQYRLNTNP